jgi:hypothetical protein
MVGPGAIRPDSKASVALEHFLVYLSHANKAAKMAAVRIAGFQPALVRQTK